MEFLDIVNKKDKVIGRNSRKAIHENHLIHRGVHVFIINKKGLLLLQKRSMNKDYYPGYYDASVGAQVLSGETYLQAAVREVKEELGVDIEELDYVCKYESFSNRQKEIRTLFMKQYDGPFQVDPLEVDLVEWQSIDSITRMIEVGEVKFTEGFKLSFTGYIEKINLESETI